MDWITPKTDWTADDYINVTDYNRVVNNLNYIKITFNIVVSAPTLVSKQIADLPVCELYNAIEQNLEAINAATYNFDIGVTKTYAANDPYIDWQEYNRIETWTEIIEAALRTAKEIQRHLAFRLGSQRTFDVPRGIE